MLVPFQARVPMHLLPGSSSGSGGCSPGSRQSASFISPGPAGQQVQILGGGRSMHGYGTMGDGRQRYQAAAERPHGASAALRICVQLDVNVGEVNLSVAVAHHCTVEWS